MLYAATQDTFYSSTVLYPLSIIRIGALNDNARAVTPSEMEFNSACMLAVVLLYQSRESSPPYPYLSLSNITFIYPLLLVSTLEITNCSRAPLPLRLAKQKVAASAISTPITQTP